MSSNRLTRSQSTATPTLLHLVCGATGAGKTTYARQLAEELGAVRFSIDEWMAALFWPDSPDPIRFDWTMERINRCEAMIGDTALKLAAVGVPSVLDLGFTRSEHRGKFAALAVGAGAGARLHWVDVSADERRVRVARRNAEKGETYRLEVTDEMFDFMESIWEPPSDEEMARLDGVRV
jgi:predicted kinase